MKLVPSVAVLCALAGCAAELSGQSGPQQGGTDDTCNAASYTDLIGQDAVAALQIPDPKRQYREGDPVTLDYAPDRVNVVLDDTDMIIRITCG